MKVSMVYVKFIHVTGSVKYIFSISPINLLWTRSTCDEKGVIKIVNVNMFSRKHWYHLILLWASYKQQDYSVFIITYVYMLQPTVNLGKNAELRTTDITRYVQKWGWKCRECREEKRSNWAVVLQSTVPCVTSSQLKHSTNNINSINYDSHIISWGKTKNSVTGWYIFDTQVVIKSYLCINRVVFVVDSILTSMEIIAN